MTTPTKETTALDLLALALFCAPSLLFALYALKKILTQGVASIFIDTTTNAQLTDSDSDEYDGDIEMQRLLRLRRSKH